MPRQEKAHLDFLDGMRGVAILAVFLFHCHGEAFGWDFAVGHARTLAAKLVFPLNLGGSGVSIFFVVSGFCIHLSHQRSARRDFATFFLRRFFRIYPPYLAALLVFSFLYPWPAVLWDRSYGWTQFFTHLLLIHNLGARTLYGINGSFWSIAVEVQLYALYPLLLWLARRLGWSRALALTAIIELGLRAYMSICPTFYDRPPAAFMANSPFAYWFGWSIGALVAEAFLRDRPLPFARVPLWLFPGLLIVAGLFPVSQPFCFLLGCLATVPFLVRFLQKADNGQPSQLAWWRRHLRFAGIVSYSVYLLHEPLVYVVVHRLMHTRLGPHPALIFLLAAAGWVPLLALAWCFYRLLELPGIALGKRMVRKCLGPAPMDYRSAEAKS